MATEWRGSSFGDLMAIPTRNGIHKGPAFQGRGVPVIKMGEIYHSDVIGDRVRDQLVLTPDELKRLEVQKDDLLFCRTSLVAEGVGHCVLVGELSERCTFASNIIRVRLDRAKASARFWFYYFRSPVGREQLLSIARGTSVTTITGPDISTLRVSVPNLDTQKAVASVLGTLDDKIELNRQMNETLEAMARARFKSWFVSLDPVRAKAEDKDTGLPKEIAELFPNAFEESELGEIPEGWRVGSILDYADLLSGGTPKTSIPEYWGGDIPWVSASDVSTSNSHFILTTVKSITKAGVENSSAKILPQGTTIITARGTVGSVAMLGRDMAMNQTNYGLKAKNGMGDYYVFYSLDALIEHLKRQAYGTIFDTITTKTFKDTEILIPSVEVVQKFDEIVTPLMDVILLNLQQSRSLSAIRDAFLPKLISGDIRIPTSLTGETDLEET